MIVGAMAELLKDRFTKQIFSALSDWLKCRIGLLTGREEKLERLRESFNKIRAVVHIAASQEWIRDQNPDLHERICQLRDAMDEAANVLDDFECREHKEQLTKNTEETKKRKSSSLTYERASKIIKVGVEIGKHLFKVDDNCKRLEVTVHKLKEILADVNTRHHPVEIRKQKQEEEEDFQIAGETGSLPTNLLIGRGNDMDKLIRWLRKTSNEEHLALDNRSDFYGKISLLSIVGHGGMGKTTLLQHVYNDEITKQLFDHKMWVYVSNNFDVKKVIADMLQFFDTKMPDSVSVGALQNLLEKQIMSQKFLLILDSVWVEEENRDISKWEKVFAPLAKGKFGSKILVTTRMASVAMMMGNVIKKKTEIFPLKALKDNDCLALFNYHAFCGEENPPDNQLISRDTFIKLSGNPLAAKVIGRRIRSNISGWRQMVNPNRNLHIITSLLDNKHIYSIIRQSYMVLPNHLRDCFAFCCMFPQDHKFDKDGLVQMWIALDFIQSSSNQRETMNDIGRRYFDDLVKNSFFHKDEDSERYYKIDVLFQEMASKFYAHEYRKVVDGEKLSLSKTIRHLYIQTKNPNILSEIGKVPYLRSLFLSYEPSNQDFYDALIEIFKSSKSLRLLYIHTPSGFEMIPEEIENLNYLRYVKIDGQDLTMLPRSLQNLYHLQYIIYNRPGVQSQPEVDEFLSYDIKKHPKLRYVNIGGTIIIDRTFTGNNEN